VTVKDGDPDRVGRRFSSAATELALAGYPGLHLTAPPAAGTVYGVYWPALVPADLVVPLVVHAGGQRVEVPHTASPAGDGGADHDQIVDASPDLALAPDAVVAPGAVLGRDRGPSTPASTTVPTRRLPLGTIVGARSGDKGGNANVGLWARTDEAWRWLDGYLTFDEFRDLLPEADGLEVRRYEFPNLRALNFVVVGLLGEGVASSTRPDPQAKGLGEYLRSRLVDLPVDLLPAGAAGPTGSTGSGSQT